MKNDVNLIEREFVLIQDENLIKYVISVRERQDKTSVILEEYFIMNDSRFEFEKNPYESREQETEKKVALESISNLSSHVFPFPKEVSIATMLKFFFINCNQNKKLGKDLLKLCENKELKIQTIQSVDTLCATKEAIEDSVNND